MTRPLAALLLVSAAATPALAQLEKGEKPTAEQVASGEVPAAPISEAERALRALPAGMPAPQWTPAAAEQLLDYVRQIGGEGLDPADYDPERLQAAIRGGDEAAS